MQEYPKVIRVGGILQTVASADEESRWLGSDAVNVPEQAPEPEPPSLPEAVVTPLTDPENTEEAEPDPKPRTHKGGKKK